MIRRHSPLQSTCEKLTNSKNWEVKRTRVRRRSYSESGYGPENLSFNKMAEIMSDVLGRDVQFQVMPMDQFEGMMRAMGTSEGMVRDYADMMIAKNEGMDRMHPNASRAETATSFREWCQEELSSSPI